MKRNAALMTAVILLGVFAYGGEPGPHHKYLEQVEWILGNWDMKGEFSDGTPFVGQESSEWCLNKNFIRSHGWFSDYEGQRVDYHITTGWDPATEKLVAWFSFGDGSHSRRVGTYDPATRSWVSHEEGVDGQGRAIACDVTLEFVNQDSWSWKGRKFRVGSESLPDLDFTFTRATSRAARHHQQWISYLAGKWTTTDQDGVAYDEVLEAASGGKSLVSRGKLADGVEYSRQIGWQADSGTLVETWCLSNGTYLVNRYQEIDEGKCVGLTTIIDVDGRTARGTILRERRSDDQLKSVYRGGLPGQTGEVEMIWISTRQ